MKLQKLLFILIVFFKTETVFSKNDLFNVNNIKIEKRDEIANKDLYDQAVGKGFDLLKSRILLDDDKKKLSDLNISKIKQLVKYYQIMGNTEINIDDYVNFNISFDKDKMHDLFYNRGVLYSDISDKELFILPILIKGNEIYIFNNNFFYENWNKVLSDTLIEFILPLENIEIIKSINDYKYNLINLNIFDIFREYSNKNIAIIFIEDNNKRNEKIYIKSIIQKKEISKSLNLKKENLNIGEFNEKIIIETKKELINLVKSKNLIDIRTPSFLNAKLDIGKKSNFVELNSKLKKTELVENIYVQEFNKNNMKLRIKYLGKLEKLINELKKVNIDLQLISNQWIIKMQ